MLILRKPFVGPGALPQRLEGLIRELGRIVDELNLELASEDKKIKEISKTVKKVEVTAVEGLRPTEIDFSEYDNGLVTEILDGNIVNGFTVEFDEQHKPIKFTDMTGRETAVIWE